MRFGLERIRKLVAVLGMPQHRFASIHVVGTNGKSSVSEITAALLEAHGCNTGAYLSPHDRLWSERIQLRGAPISPDQFAAAVERVAEAVPVVERTFDEGERVTQFEADTAVAFIALAVARVEVAVIEAGLGGRLDATNVLPSRVSVLTSIGLEHTQWLGQSEVEIATEKLAVLRDRTTLVLGPVSTEVEDLARATASERHCELITVRDLAPAIELATSAPYLRRNFAVSLAATEALLGRLELDRVRMVAAGLQLNGRAQVVAGEPMVILDAAHNPDGARALAEALPELAGGRPVTACVALLMDKDAEGIIGALSPVISAMVATELPADRLATAGRPGARALPCSDLARIGIAAGVESVAQEADPTAAIALGRSRAAAAGGVLVVCGSHYLVGFAQP